MATSFIDFAVASGADENALMQSVSVSGDQLRNPDGRLTEVSYLRLQKAAVDATGDTLLPLKHAADATLWHLSVDGLIVEAAGALPNAIAELNRYTGLLADVPVGTGDERFELSWESGNCLLIDHLPVNLVGPTAIEESFASFVSCFRIEASEVPLAQDMWLTIQKPPHYALYDEIFAMPVHFGAKHNALRIDERWLDPSLATEHPYASRIVKVIAESLMARLGSSGTFRARLEQELLGSLRTGQMKMDSLARDLGLSKRTSQRRLRDEGTSFAEVYDHLRLRIAQDHLKGGRYSISEIAYLVGYSETPAFMEAFKNF